MQAPDLGHLRHNGGFESSKLCRVCRVTPSRSTFGYTWRRCVLTDRGGSQRNRDHADVSRSGVWGPQRELCGFRAVRVKKRDGPLRSAAATERITTHASPIGSMAPACPSGGRRLWRTIESRDDRPTLRRWSTLCRARYCVHASRGASTTEWFVKKGARCDAWREDFRACASSLDGSIDPVAGHDFVWAQSANRQ